MCQMAEVKRNARKKGRGAEVSSIRQKCKKRKTLKNASKNLKSSNKNKILKIQLSQIEINKNGVKLAPEKRI